MKMFHGSTIEELIQAVERVERESRAVTPADMPVRVTRYEVNPGFVYAMQFTEPAMTMGAA
jgi:hypothetical protein